MTAELRLRLISAAVMIALVGLVLWIGGWTLNLFICLAGLILLSEYWGLVRRIARRSSERLLWLLCGVAYIGIACLALAILPPVARLVLICAVIAVDSGAYFAGRAIGGPKIAPAISPSKTWAGLGGGMVGAALVLCGALVFLARIRPDLGVLHGIRPDVVPVAALFWVSLLGALIAICAQAGDFLESWLKRRAGVKDSGTIIPGHGGLLDRVDGLMPAAILAGFVYGAGWL